MRRILIFVFCCVSAVFAQPWVMFNDLDDTYLYDQASGQVYIRVKKGGKNYEDTFMKMGIVDGPSKKASNSSNLAKPQTPKKAESQTSEQEEQQKLLRQAQELQRSIQGSILGGE